ncbi:MAG: ABC-2 family transporter protein [Patescibacteria group bacterium]
MLKHLKIAQIYIKLNLQKILAYRLNAFFNLLTTTVFLITFVLSLYLTFKAVPIIGGYSFDQMLSLLFLAQIWWFLQVMFVRKNMQYIAESINSGSLDMYLLKPVKLWFLMPFLQLDANHLVPTVFYSGVFIWQAQHFQANWWQSLLAVFFFLNSVMIIYFFISLFTFSNFWIGRNYSIFDISFQFPDFLQIPVEFFTGNLKWIFTFLIPLIPMVNPSLQILMGKLDITLMFTSLALTATLGLLSYTLWKKGLRSYTSAN